MASTLADEFLADLDEDAGEPEVKQEEEDPDMDAAMEDGEQQGDDDDEKDLALEEKLKATLKNEDITKVATLLASSKFKNLIKRVEEKIANPKPLEIIGPIEEDPEYQLIVESNALVTEIHSEIQVIHKYVRDRYAKKFPELESLVLNPLDYARVVKRIANQTDLTQVDLTDLIPAASIMIVSVAASTTTGEPLEEAEWLKIAKACDMALELDECRKKILTYVESRMIFIAPNLSALAGSSVAAKLIAAAGGLSALSKIPACNLILLGAPKKNLGGFSTAQSKRFMQGYIFETDVVQKTPPSLRAKSIRVLGPKTTVAARIDSNNGDKSGDMGRKLKEEIQKKIDKWQEPPPTKQPKPLPAPDDRPRKKRAGKRVRKMKEKYATTDMRKHQNRMAFGVQEEETMEGKGLGMLMSGSGKVRMSAQEKGLLKKQKQQEKQQQQQQKFGGAAGFATSGFTTSLAFTPVQGLELANPVAQAQAAIRVKQANERYFSQDQSFFKVKKQKTDETPAPS
eukprot:Phypoly_transcript_06726.p1 GENE.Phypoly_transcript_06726~~Phypoly_transcript_06726.p1  ORF type:complete len:512 (+),score=126.15 Phypoly_transcript_06726:118-1653(+)